MVEVGRLFGDLIHSIGRSTQLSGESSLTGDDPRLLQDCHKHRHTCRPVAEDDTAAISTTCGKPIGALGQQDPNLGPRFAFSNAHDQLTGCRGGPQSSSHQLASLDSNGVALDCCSPPERARWIAVLRTRRDRAEAAEARLQAELRPGLRGTGVYRA